MSTRLNIYNAIIFAESNDTFSQLILQKKLAKGELNHSEYRFCLHVLQGYYQRKNLLFYYLKQFCHVNLPKKKKERVIVLLALYEYLFLSTPIYALSNEWMNVAKCVTGKYFSKFLNQLMRKWKKAPFATPIPVDIKLQSLVFSVPEDYIKLLRLYWSNDRIYQFLVSSILPKPIFVRNVNAPLQQMPSGGSKWNAEQFSIVSELPEDLSCRSDIYIQNPAQFNLMSYLYNKMPFIPEQTLDSCASPGGKSLFLSKAYPRSNLVSNDISIERSSKLKENIQRFAIETELSICDFLHFPEDRKFDLVVIDAPCSNSGVLSKRAEARYRLTKSSIDSLVEIQSQMIIKAKKLLSANGVIWYLTCSVLPQENHFLLDQLKMEGVIKDITAYQYSEPCKMIDGGFGAILQP